jgi:hypothetical protein
MTGIAAENRRQRAQPDRRKHSRGGRRLTDPRDRRRMQWRLAAYSTYLSLRAWPSAVRRLLTHSGRSR